MHLRDQELIRNILHTCSRFPFFKVNPLLATQVELLKCRNRIARSIFFLGEMISHVAQLPRETQS